MDQSMDITPSTSSQISKEFKTSLTWEDLIPLIQNTEESVQKIIGVVIRMLPPNLSDFELKQVRKCVVQWKSQIRTKWQDRRVRKEMTKFKNRNQEWLKKTVKLPEISRGSMPIVHEKSRREILSAKLSKLRQAQSIQDSNIHDFGKDLYLWDKMYRESGICCRPALQKEMHFQSN